MTKADNSDIVNETDKDIDEGYHIDEVIDDKTKEVSYDLMCDGEFVFAALNKPDACKFMEGHRNGVIFAGRKSDKNAGDNGGSVDPSKVKTPDADKSPSPTKGDKSAAPKPRRLL